MELSPKTHMRIHQELVGKPVVLKEGISSVHLETTVKMAADEKGLVHGGFIFSLADYAAMLAVNHPLVVLASANVSFISPVSIGEKVIASAEVIEKNGKKRVVSVHVKRDEVSVFKGEFLCIVPDRHVLE